VAVDSQVSSSRGGSSTGLERQRQARIAVSTIFLVNGFTLASWISRIPSIKDKLDLSSGEVGTALMAMAAGAIVAFSIAGRLIDARSSAFTLLLSGFTMVAALPFVGVAPHMLLLMTALFVFGASNGAMDVSMNAQGVEVERFINKNIMSSLHGFFSLGAFCSAANGAVMAHVDLEPLPHFLIVTAIGAVVLSRIRGWLIPDQPDAREHEESPVFAFPPRSLWALGALALFASMSEGAMSDWSGIYLQDHLGKGNGFAALGFTVFSIFMLIGRFSGDWMVEKFGAPRIVRIGGLVGATGLGVATIIDQPNAMLAGFGAVGIGLATIYPLVFSAAGNHPTLPRGRAVAAVATVGYTGFLAGPPILGWIAEFTTLRIIMVTVVLLTAGTAALAGATRTAGTHVGEIEPEVVPG